MTPTPAPTLAPAGWREWVALPDLSPVPIKAKLDTGARTSALHAHDMVVSEGADPARVAFELHPIQRSSRHRTRVDLPVESFRRIRSSTGHTERRPVVTTPIRIGDHAYEIELTLTARDEMGFRLLLGRSALRRRFVVDAGRSFLNELPEPTE